MVAVVTCESVAIASEVRDIWKAGSGGIDWRAHLAGPDQRVKGGRRRDKHDRLSEKGLRRVCAAGICEDMATTPAPPRLLPSGDSAITVEFSRDIDDDANQRVLALDRAIASAPIAGVSETVPTYRSLLVHYDPVRVGYEALGARLLELAEQAVPEKAKTRRWRIPVTYGGEHGIDLEDVAKALNTSADDIVARHAAGDYRVAMIGFTPGWSYLSGLDPSLQMPRRQDPRLMTPAGTISIGGVQTGVQCLAGPSGWHLLGRTPVRTYQLHRDPIFLLEPGDHVVFCPVDAKIFAEQDRAAEAGEIVAELLPS
jgi:KipI family sensor histidine kinase inhibitor